MNDGEREDWINNDEGLYDWWRSSEFRGNINKFIRANRAEIDEAISPVLEGTKSAHHLKYG